MRAEHGSGGQGDPATDPAAGGDAGIARSIQHDNRYRTTCACGGRKPRHRPRDRPPPDVGDYEATKSALGEKADKQAPDVVVFNAGIARDNLLVWMTKEEWDAVMGTNLDGFYNVVHTVLFPMLREKRGRIVLISSTSGQIGQAGQVNYSAAKAGLIGAAKALAREVGRKHLLVNVVAPGVIETEMAAHLPKDQILPLIPLQRFGTVEDVAEVVNFLCAEEHMYIHGQVIGVNGGLAI